jgi:hypothetical protein
MRYIIQNAQDFKPGRRNQNYPVALLSALYGFELSSYKAQHNMFNSLSIHAPNINTSFFLATLLSFAQDQDFYSAWIIYQDWEFDNNL